MRIHIVEDDPIIAADIKITLTGIGHQVEGNSYNAHQCQEFLKSHQVDLLLLDIDLGKNSMDGISLSKFISKSYGYSFVYLTSYYDDATLKRASETNPSAYVLKPFEEKDLKVALDMVNYKSAIAHHKHPDNNTTNHRLFVKNRKGYMNPVEVKDILYFNACDNYCYIFTAISKDLVLQRLKHFSEQYHSLGFLQVHRSYVINLNHITQISEDHVFINQHKIPIGKSYKKEFFAHLQIV